MSAGNTKSNSAGPRESDWRSAGISLLLHVILIVALGLLWRSRVVGGGDEAPRRVGIVLTSADQAEEYVDQAEPEPVESTASTDAPIAEALPEAEQPPLDTSSLLTESAPLDLPLPGLNSSDLATPDSRPSSALPVELSQEQLAMLEAERAAFEARQPKGAPTTLSVFGSGDMTGRRFVFVLDRSRSMGSQGLNVLSAASDELADAVESLESNHEFQVVAYHHQTLTITRRDLLPVTGNSKREVRDFVDNLAAFGGTEHEAGLLTAIAMNPDVILLLTDGGLPELNQSQLRRIRRAAGATQIHCIQFGDGPRQGRGDFMRQLAAENNGTYRYVDVSKWRKGDSGLSGDGQ